MTNGKHNAEAELRRRIGELQEFEAKLQESKQALERIKQLFGKGKELRPREEKETKFPAAGGD